MVTPKRPAAAPSGTKKAASATHDAAYWERRLHSGEFKRALTALVAEELTAVAGERVKHVIDPRQVRRLLERRAPRLTQRAALAELMLRAQGVVGERIKATQSSVRGLMEPGLAASIDAILEENLVFSKPMEDFISDLMGQEFIQRLFTDIIFTAIVSFNERVNPLFGRLTMGMLEDQIRSFIGFFMPMVQKQAVAFAVSRRNQAILFGFTRAIARRLLDEPLPHYFAMLSGGQRRGGDRLVKQALADKKLEVLVADLTLAVWDEIYETIQDWTVGDLLELETNAAWLADRVVEMLLPLLGRPRILQFIAAEFAHVK